MTVRPAQTDADVERCFPVLVQLRPSLDPATFLADVRRQEASGYRLALLEEGGEVRAVAGYRVLEMLSRGRFLYVDDLVTDKTHRSRGAGGVLFDWLMDEARAHGCQRIDLDSGVQREAAHRFYLRKKMWIVGLHLTVPVQNGTAPPAPAERPSA